MNASQHAHSAHGNELAASEADQLADALDAWDGVLMMPTGWRELCSIELRRLYAAEQELAAQRSRLSAELCPDGRERMTMGQAKARGTFEQRRAEAVERNEAVQREREKAKHAAGLERKARRAQEVAQPERPGLDRTERRRQGHSMLAVAGRALAASAIHSQAMKRHNV